MCTCVLVCWGACAVVRACVLCVCMFVGEIENESPTSDCIVVRVFQEERIKILNRRTQREILASVFSVKGYAVA